MCPNRHKILIYGLNGLIHPRNKFRFKICLFRGKFKFDSKDKLQKTWVTNNSFSYNFRGFDTG